MQSQMKKFKPNVNSTHKPPTYLKTEFNKNHVYENIIQTKVNENNKYSKQNIESNAYLRTKK